ncbi:MAG: NAD-dependent epimerase/dehydratase family protein [Myxococcota bacterium]
MRALVTGGGGFLGRRIVEMLQARGDEVVVLARGEYPDLPLVRGDVSDADAVRRAAEGCDAVFHVAAKAGVWGPRAEYERSNIVGTQNVLAACLGLGVRTLVYTSSPSVVFDGAEHVDAKNDLPYPDHYEAIYPATKARAERLVLEANGPKLATVALRPHLIYGPGDPHLLPRLFARQKAGRLRIVGDGENRVSLTFVDNAASAHVAACDALKRGAPFSGKAFFVNDAEPVRVWDWLNELFEHVGLPRVTRRVPLWAARAAGGLAEAVWSLGLDGEPPMTRFVAQQLATTHTYDLGPARDAFGWTPPVAGNEALARTAAWWSGRVLDRKLGT